MVMAKPFEGILGNSCELRTIEFLLPLKEMEFNITELGDEIGVTWPTISKTIKKFVEYGVMKVACERNGTKYYQIDESSPFVLLFENLNNLLIEHMLGEDMLYQINEYRESDAPVRKLDVQCDVESWSPTPPLMRHRNVSPLSNQNNNKPNQNLPRRHGSGLRVREDLRRHRWVI